MMSAYKKKIHEDFDWALGLNRFTLRLMGVWPEDYNIDKQSFMTNLRVPAMIGTMFLCLFLPQMYALTLVIHELPLVVDNLLTSSPSFISCIKLFFIWRSKKVLEPVIRSMTRDWSQKKTDWELSAMRRQAIRGRIFTISGYVFVAAVYVGFAVAPLFGLNIRMISNITDYGDRYLFVQSYFPYDYSKSPNFELTHGCQLIGAFFIGMSVSIPENYFGALVFHASAQFEILGAKMENFIRKDYDQHKGSESMHFRRRLGELVDRHVHLMSLVSAIEDSFSFSIVAQIFCMMMMVICLGFQILNMFGPAGNRSSVIQLVTLFGTVFTLMMHTLVDCFASETLATKSVGLFYHIYFSRWYLIPRHSTSDLIPTMIISKSPRLLTAGKILNLSLASYCSILKSTAGYISVLIAVSGR